MKKYLIPTLLCFTSIFIISCKNEISYNYLNGRWQTTYINIKTNIEDISPNLVNSTKNMALSISYTFDSTDSSYIESSDYKAIMDFSYKREGKYIINKTKNTLILIPKKYFQRDENKNWINTNNKNFLSPVEYKISDIRKNSITLDNGNKNIKETIVWERKK